MAHRRVQVDRFDRVPGGEVHAVEHLAQAEQVAEVVAGALEALAVEPPDVRRAGDAPEGDVIAADRQGVRRVAGVQAERRRTGGDRLDHHRRIEADPRRVVGHVGTGGAQELAGVWIEEVHADLGEDPQRRIVDRLELVGGHRLHRAPPQPRLLEGSLLGECAARRRRAGTDRVAASSGAPAPVGASKRADDSPAALARAGTRSLAAAHRGRLLRCQREQRRIGVVAERHEAGQVESRIRCYGGVGDRSGERGAERGHPLGRGPARYHDRQARHERTDT